VARIFEVRYKDGTTIVAHQHASEHFAKIDAKAISKSNGRALLGEMDYEKDNFVRVCEYAGGVQGKWENRHGAITPCKVLLTVEDTKQDEPTNIQVQPKAEISDEEKEKKKAALARIREAQRPKEDKSAGKPTTDGKSVVKVENEKRTKLIADGHTPVLADLICKSGVHVGSPNCNGLIALFNGNVTDKDFPTMRPKELNALMSKLRALLISNDTGKSIVTRGGSKGLVYSLVDYVLEIIEEVA
jgi:hypothetical protein